MKTLKATNNRTDEVVQFEIVPGAGIRINGRDKLVSIKWFIQNFTKLPLGS